MGLLFLMRGILAAAEDVVGTSGGTFVPNEGHFFGRDTPFEGYFTRR